MSADETGEVRLVVGGRERSDWAEYSISSSLEVPADDFSLTLGTHLSGFLTEVKRGAAAQVYVQGQLALTGLVDSTSPNRAKRSRYLRISGRDMAGLLVRHQLEPAIYKGLNLEQLAHMVCKPLGLTKIRVTGVASLTPIAEVQINPGQRAWSLLSNQADRQGVGLWMDPDGTLLIGKPAPTSPVGRLLDYSDPARSAANNVLSLDPSESALGLYGKTVVLSQAQGNQWFNRAPANEIRAEAINPDLTGPMAALAQVIHDDDILTQAEARNVAQRRMNDGIRKSSSLTIHVAGHLAPNGKIWKPGTLVGLVSEDLAIDRDYLILARTLRKSRSVPPGTELQLAPKGSWP